MHEGDVLGRKRLHLPVIPDVPEDRLVLRSDDEEEAIADLRQACHPLEGPDALQPAGACVVEGDAGSYGMQPALRLQRVEQRQPLAVGTETNVPTGGLLELQERASAAAVEIAPLPVAAFFGTIVEQAPGIGDSIAPPAQVGQGDVALIQVGLRFL